MRVVAIVSEGDDMAERVVDQVIRIPNCSELLQSVFDPGANAVACLWDSGRTWPRS